MSKKYFLAFVICLMVLSGCSPQPSTERVRIEGGFTETYTAFSSRFSDLLRSSELEMSSASSAKHIIRSNNFKTSRLSHQVGEWTVYYSVGVDWEAYPGASGYRIYHSVNGGPFTLADDWPLEPGEHSSGGYIYSEDYAPGSTYSYYVVAYGPDWETSPSEIVTISPRFLPPIFLKYPPNGSTVFGSPFTLKWEIGDVHPSIPEATDLLPETNVHVFDPITFDRYFVFETYDFVEQATCSEELESGRYKWYVQMEGQDGAGNYISSHGDVWTFTYQK